MNTTKRKFLLEEAPQLFQSLDPNTEPRFGLMTAQHMIEHILGDRNYIMSRIGEPDPALAERQAGFRKFVDKGAIFKYRPSDKTKADLPELKYASFDAALAEFIPIAGEFYTFYEKNPDFKVYNKFMGEMELEKVEHFVYQHWRWHAYQFNLLESFP